MYIYLLITQHIYNTYKINTIYDTMYKHVCILYTKHK